MTAQIIKFMYIRRKFSLPTFLMKLKHKLELTNQECSSINIIYTYPDGKRPLEEYGLRLETSNDIINSRLMQQATYAEERQFPFIEIDGDKIVFVPAEENKEKFCIMEMRTYSELNGHVLRVPNRNNDNWQQLLSIFEVDFNVRVSYLAMYGRYYHVAFYVRGDALKAARLLSRTNYSISYASQFICVSRLPEAVPNIVIIANYENVNIQHENVEELAIQDQQQQAVADDNVENQAQPLAENGGKDIAIQTDISQLQLAELFKEVEDLKKKINGEKTAEESLQESTSDMSEYLTASSSGSSVSSSSSASSSADSVRTVVGTKVKVTTSIRKK